MSGQHDTLAYLPLLKKKVPIERIEGWPQGASGLFGEEENFLRPTGLQVRILQPVASSNTDCALPAPAFLLRKPKSKGLTNKPETPSRYCASQVRQLWH